MKKNEPTKDQGPIGLDAKEVEALKDQEVEKKGFTNDELLEVIAEKFNDVPSKSAMLKLLRSEGHSVAQNRCYNAYLQVAMAIEKKAKEAK